jgi:glycosyltransferase involved in cell wall biosynthesis
MLISVIITSYNYDKFIERAIRSVFNQSIGRNEYELLIVDDASTDNTLKVLDNYKEDVRLICLKTNKGLAAARNEGLRKSKGQYVLFLDADDYIHRDLLKLQSLYLTENNSIDAISTDYYIRHINAEERPIACGIMFRKDLLFEIGLYDERFRAREEEDLRIRFLKKYSIYNIILPLYRYRKHDANLTNDKRIMKKYKRRLSNKHKK